MNIPKRYKIGGQWFDVKLMDLVDKGDNYGTMQYCPPLISIATKYQDGDCQLKNISDNQIRNTYWHEVIHSFQYMAGLELDERVASTFAAFMCELEETQEF